MRNGVESPIGLDHAVVDRETQSLLMVHIPDQARNPVHLRGQSLQTTWYLTSDFRTSISCESGEESTNA
jgi:hypothetical protein